MSYATVPDRFEYVSLSLDVVGARRSMESFVYDSLLFGFTRALAAEYDAPTYMVYLSFHALFSSTK